MKPLLLFVLGFSFSLAGVFSWVSPAQADTILYDNMNLDMSQGGVIHYYTNPPPQGVFWAGVPPNYSGFPVFYSTNPIGNTIQLAGSSASVLLSQVSVFTYANWAEVAALEVRDGPDGNVLYRGPLYVPAGYGWIEADNLNLPVPGTFYFSVQFTNLGQGLLLSGSGAVGSTGDANKLMAQAVAASSDPLPADVVFLQQPQDLTAAVGGEAVFTVKALSVGVRSFQWKHQGQNLTDNETVHGAQTPRLVISSVSGADVGDYQVLVGAKFLTTLGAFLSASNSATAHLTIGTITNSPPWFGQVQLREDHFLQLEIHGVPGTAYRLDVSSNLTDWTPLFTTNAPAGVFDLSDGPISGQNRRYYRLAAP